MKKSLLFILPIAGVIGYSFFSGETSVSKYHNDGILETAFSSNPPGARTGAPGEANCTMCHSGEVMSAAGVVDFTLSGGPSYTPGSSYPITISTVGGAKNGFELTILDASNNQVGSFTAGEHSSVTVEGGKEYIRHSASDGVTAWNFEWTAPDVESGELTAYYIMNKSNNNGSTSGDEIFVGNVTIPSFFAGVEENKIDNAYSVYVNQSTKQLNLSYALIEDSKVVLNVQDLSGRLIQYYDLGNQSTGSYTEQLPLDQVSGSGVYIVSLFVGNKVYNRKVMID